MATPAATYRKSSAARMAALLFVLSALCAACQRPAGSFAYRHAPADGWDATDTLEFHIDTLQQAGTYLLTVGLRTAAARPGPFRTISLQVEEHWDNAAMRLRPVVCPLADEDGNSSGHGVSLHQHTFPADTLHLQAGQNGRIVLRHTMQRQVLTGITDIGIRLQKLH